MSTERDELALADLIEDAVDDTCYNADRLGPSALAYTVALRAAEATLAAGYRKPQQVTTVEELDALPVGSVVLDRDGMALQRTKWLGWVASNGSTNIDREELERDCFPATVLHVGGAE